MSGYLLAGIILAVSLILLHVGLALRARARPELASGGTLILSATGFTTGLKLLVICVTTKHFRTPFADEDHVYIFLGGVALMWVSADHMIRAAIPETLPGKKKSEGER